MSYPAKRKRALVETLADRALLRCFDLKQVRQSHDRLIALNRVLDGAVDLAKFRHERHRHGVSETITALARFDDHHREAAGRRFFRGNLQRALTGTGVDAELSDWPKQATLR